MKPGKRGSLLPLLLAVPLFFGPLALGAGGTRLMREDRVHVVRKGDTLERIGGVYGTDWAALAKRNGLDPGAVLPVGRRIRVETRRLVPWELTDGIVINVPERMLYFFRRGELTSFPVGLGKTSWRTPSGSFTVTRKEKGPTWYVPRAMQEEMRREGEPVRKVVPPGPDNPLGRYAVRLSIGTILIHETIWPGTVYRFQSHGCVRVHPEHIEPFFREVEIGTPGRIIYTPVKAGVLADGRIFVEIHGDIYGLAGDPAVEARRALGRLGVADRVNWEKVAAVAKERTGMAEDVTR